MSAFRRIIRNSGLRVPQPAAAMVDWGDSINTGMLDTWLFNEASPGNIRPLVGPARTATLATTNYPTPGLSPLGRGRNYVAASSQIMLTGDTMPALAVPFSAFAIARVTANASTYTVFSYQATTGNNGFRFEFNNEQFRVVLGAVANMNSTLSTANTTWYALGYTKLNTGVAGDVIYAAVLGNQPTINTTGSNSMSGSPARIVIGGSQNNVNALGGDIALLRIWNKRGLTQNDFMRLFADPMAGIVAPRRRFSRPSGVAATFNPGWTYGATKTIGAVF